MKRKEYIEPNYEVLLLDAGNVIKTSGEDWEGGEVPLMSNQPDSGSVWGD